MLEVCFDLSAARQQAAGISRYERELAIALLKLAEPAEYSYFYAGPPPEKPLPAPLDRLPHIARYTSNKRWRLRLWLGHLARRPADQMVLPVRSGQTIFHGMDYIAPYLNAPTILTVYDLSFLLFPNLHSRYNRLYLRYMLPIIARRARRIIVPSENTRRDLENWLGAPIGERVRVTPLGLSDESYLEDLPQTAIRAGLAKYGLLDQPYLLSVGTIEPRKNLGRLIEAYSSLVKTWDSPEPCPALVLVGRVGWLGEYERLQAKAAEYGLEWQSSGEISANRPGPRILALSAVTDGDLKALYQGAKLSCYPSLYEGFGLPALEAMAAGKPLICSDRASLPEVTGPDGAAALLINPENPGEIVAALKRGLQDSELARRLGRAGRERARIFTWQRTAELTFQVYREVHNLPPSPG